MMSNPLCLAVADAASTRPVEAATSQPAPPGEFSHLLMALVGIGICALIVWLIRRLNSPSRLSLANTPGRPNTVNPIAVLLLFFGWALAQAVFARIIVSPMGWFEEGDPRAEILLNGISPLIMTAGALAIANVSFSGGIRRGMGLTARHWPWDTLRGILGYLAVLPLCIGLQAVMAGLLPENLRQTHRMLVALGEVSSSWKVMIVLASGLLAPVAEELFFRGLVQSMLRQFVRSPWVAIVVTSICFTVIHAPYWDSLHSLFLLSVALGYNYERCGRLWPAILMHALFNLVFLRETMIQSGA